MRRNVCRASMIFLYFSLILFVEAEELRSKRNLPVYICGQPPYQFYSQTPCPQTNVQPPQQQQPYKAAGASCSNGGTYLGWTCQQAPQCQFTTSAGILTGQCVQGLCCTQASRRTSSRSNSQCPSNLMRSSHACTRDSQCLLSSNKGQRLVGQCRGRTCCMPKLRASSTRRRTNQCRADERRNGQLCSRAQACYPTRASTTVTCRGDKCCEREVRGTGAVCPQGGEPRGNCQLGQATCLFARNGVSAQGVCYNGLCCAEQRQGSSNPCGRGVWVDQKRCGSFNNFFCADTDKQCTNGHCCAPA